MDLEKIREALGTELFPQVQSRLKGLKLEILDPQEGKWVESGLLEDSRKTEEKVRREAEDFRGRLREMEAGLAQRDAEIARLTVLQGDWEEKCRGLEGEMEKRNRSLEELRAGLEERDGTIRALHRDAYERRLVHESRARDPEVVMKLLDQDRVRPEKDGTWSGVREQLEGLKRRSAYLFHPEADERGGFVMGAGRTREGADVNTAIRSAFGR